MKVGELIEELKKYASDKEVIVAGCYGSQGQIDKVDEDGIEYSEYGKNVVFLESDICSG